VQLRQAFRREADGKFVLDADHEHQHRDAVQAEVLLQAGLHRHMGEICLRALQRRLRNTD